MIIEGMISYPIDSAQEYFNRVERSTTFPQFINIQGPFVGLGQKGIVQQFIYYEFEDSKTLEAFRVIFDHFDKFLDIPGITLSAKALMDSKEKKLGEEWGQPRPRWNLTKGRKSPSF
jgi:hypothetical protein